jgi:hypothetical protein
LAPGRAVFHQIRKYLRYANDCAQGAKASFDCQRRHELLDMQLQWLSIARSYEFFERLDFSFEYRSEVQRSAQIIEEAALGHLIRFLAH